MVGSSQYHPAPALVAPHSEYSDSPSENQPNWLTECESIDDLRIALNWRNLAWWITAPIAAQAMVWE